MQTPLSPRAGGEDLVDRVPAILPQTAIQGTGSEAGGRRSPLPRHLAGRASVPLVFLASLAFPAKSLADGLLSGGANGMWNDFASYWLAGKLVWSGHTPYDLTALVRLGHQQGLVFQAGTGYSYPLP